MSRPLAEDRGATGAPEYGPALLARIAALCEADPGRERCGFVVRRDGALEVVAVENVADRYHARDPVHFPRTSRDSYLVDPGAQLRLLEELSAGGGGIVAVWHSHVEAEAWFSDKDRADAVVDGAQILPEAEYLVFGLRGGKVTEGRRYRFVAGTFEEWRIA